jgi:hypothetical protein
MSDDEFNKWYENEYNKKKIETEGITEEEIKEKLDEFEQDYDLTDMKVNDKIVLRNLVVTMISLEKIEEVFAEERSEISDSNILLITRISDIMSKLRGDISKMQDDLKLTRKIRKDSQEENFMAWLDNMKVKAREFYKRKMLYIFCPECRFLLANVWLLYPDADNTLHLECHHENCGNKFDINLKELYSTDNKNLEDVIIP